MSRCFPLPPRWYARNCANNDALILSIKLQQEREEKRKERKQKKEKKRDKKEKGKSKAVSDDNGHKSDSLDRSTLTEEHRLPCNSSESTENTCKKTDNSSKRKIHLISSQSHGNVIRIRLSSRRNESTVTCVDEHQCSTSGRTYAATVQGERSGLCHYASLTSSSSLQVTAGTTKGEMHTPPTLRMGRKVIILNDGGSASYGRMQNEERLYRNLIENLVPSPVDNELNINPDDQDWLFETKRGDGRAAKRLRAFSNQSPTCENVELQPQARYMADIGMYALPFSVPF